MASADRIDGSPREIAWGHIADGFAAALWVEGLDRIYFERFTSAYRHASIAAGRLDRRLDPRPPEHCERVDEEREARRAEMRAPGGVDAVLDFIVPWSTRMRVMYPLFRSAVTTVAQLRDLLEDNSILNVGNIGPKRAQLLRDALAAYDEGESR